MPIYIADSYLYRAVGANVDGACGKCIQSRSDCMCHSLSRMDICEIIEDAPAADVVERKNGRWIWVDGVRCSNCNYKLQTTGLPAYCPNCGAEMRKELNKCL